MIVQKSDCCNALLIVDTLLCSNCMEYCLPVEEEVPITEDHSHLIIPNDYNS